MKKRWGRSTRTMMLAGMVALAPLTMPIHAQTQVIELKDLGTVHPGFRIEGANAKDYSGISVSGAGDVNGDGLSDLIIGAYGADPKGKNRAGESYLIFGKTDGDSIDLNNIGTQGIKIDGIDVFDFSGIDVAGVGDVNGDGLTDFIINSVYADPSGKSNAGESYVIFGNQTYQDIDLNNLGNAGFRIDGANTGDFSGFSVSGLGDMNGDSLDDLLIGAFRANPNSKKDAGITYVVYGKVDTSVVDLSNLGPEGFLIEGIDINDYSGVCVSGTGDVNGDGIVDLLIGASDADPGGRIDAGESYVIFGKNDTLPVSLSNLGTSGFRIDGIDRGDLSGRALRGAGDVNGDGLNDIIIGAFHADPNGHSNAGESYVVFGKSNNDNVELANLGSGGFRIEGVDSLDFSGLSACGAGDLNGDGFGDLIIGARFADPDGVSNAGESYIVFGKMDNTTVELESLGLGGIYIKGVNSKDYSGHCVSGVGDVNGDGLSDFIIGGDAADPNGRGNAGESYVVFNPWRLPMSATYRATTRAGDAPRLAVGIIGDGSNDSSPDARAWIDFVDGDNVSLQTVTLTRNNSSIAGIPRIPDDTSPSLGNVHLLNPIPANVMWQLSTTRTGWTNAEVTFKYTNAEIARLEESGLKIYQASSPTGPWSKLPTTLNASRNTASATVTSLSYFALAAPALPITMDAWMVH